MTGKVPNLPASPAGYKTKGVVRVVWHSKYQRFVAYAWPKSNGTDTATRKQGQQYFSDAVKLIKQNPPEMVDAAMQLSANTPFLPRDLMMRAAYGKLTDVVLKDGTKLTSRREYVLNIQAVLDSITSTPGVILARIAEAWVGLLPGTTGQVLTVDAVTGFPIWADASVPAIPVTSVSTGTGLTENASTGDVIVSLATCLDARVVANLSGGTAVPLPHSVSDVLDYIMGNANGMLLTRGVAGWSALAAGAASTMLQSQGPGQPLQWAAANASGGGSNDLYAPPAIGVLGTQINSNAGATAPSITAIANCGTLIKSGLNASGWALRGYVKTPVNTASITLTARLRTSGVTVGSYEGAGIVAVDGVKWIGFGRFNGTQFGLNNAAAYTGNPGSTTYQAQELCGREHYVRMSLASGTWTFQVSSDGVTWVTVGTLANPLGTLTGVGIGQQAYNAATVQVCTNVLYWNETTP